LNLLSGTAERLIMALIAVLAVTESSNSALFAHFGVSFQSPKIDETALNGESLVQLKGCSAACFIVPVSSKFMT
jgi:hypothetical protein